MEYAIVVEGFGGWMIARDWDVAVEFAEKTSRANGRKVNICIAEAYGFGKMLATFDGKEA